MQNTSFIELNWYTFVIVTPINIHQPTKPNPDILPIYHLSHSLFAYMYTLPAFNLLEYFKFKCTRRTSIIDNKDQESDWREYIDHFVGNSWWGFTELQCQSLFLTQQQYLDIHVLWAKTSNLCPFFSTITSFSKILYIYRTWFSVRIIHVLNLSVICQQIYHVYLFAGCLVAWPINALAFDSDSNLQMLLKTG